ncbi:hypothetical protein MNBD_GAMMA25-105 [hydrothermal vent metagenome]|uniref:Uncharacterized protein n=1 Tax=hydrothermal vent metagenome TaxID=652676 RepID=A0A3B1BAM0_9ZZZZ
MSHLIYLLVVLFFLAACGGGEITDTYNGELSSLSESLIVTSAHGDSGSAWGLPDCSACHKLGVIHEQADNIRALVQLRGYDSCAGCHGNNGTGILRQCLICHNQNDLPATPHQDGVRNHGFIADVEMLANDDSCFACHNNSDMDGRFDLNRDLSRFMDASQNYRPYSSLNDFCLRCHNRDHQQQAYPVREREPGDTLVTIEESWKHIDRHGEIDGLGARIYTGLRDGYVYSSRVGCTDCHTMHGSNNLKLIIGRSDNGVSLLDSSLRNRPYDVSISNGDFSQLCVLCHQMQSISDQGDEDTGNGLSGVHATGSDCRECHSHGEVVQAGM